MYPTTEWRPDALWPREVSPEQAAEALRNLQALVEQALDPARDVPSVVDIVQAASAVLLARVHGESLGWNLEAVYAEAMAKANEVAEAFGRAAKEMEADKRRLIADVEYWKAEAFNAGARTTR